MRKNPTSQDRAGAIDRVSAAEQGNWGLLWAHLVHGSERPHGIRLSREECRVLYEILNGHHKPPAHRPHDDEAENRRKVLTVYSRLLELNGKPLKTAISITMERYHVSRASVFAARKEWLSQFLASGFDAMPPGLRQLLQERMEKTIWSN
jgi:hypothetical protein